MYRDVYLIDFSVCLAISQDNGYIAGRREETDRKGQETFLR